jgi:uncharacterized protein YihD (DUF1040 family)
MVELNEKDLCIEVHEQLSWDGSVKFVFNEIKEELSDWYENNLEDIKEDGIAYDASYEDMENCGKFLDFVSGMEKDWSREFKVAVLKNIIEHWNNVSYREDCEVSIFDEDIIREGIFQTIEEEFDFDGRMGY